MQIAIEIRLTNDDVWRGLPRVRDQMPHSKLLIVGVPDNFDYIYVKFLHIIGDTLRNSCRQRLTKLWGQFSATGFEVVSVGFA